MGFTTYEPAPNTAYYHTGIGGAGNYRKLTKEEVAAPKSKAHHDIKPVSRPFYGGRGGVGNAHAASERAMFSFDEELQRDKLRRESVAPMYAVGRGGAGNIVPHEEEGSDEERVSMEGSVRRLSESTTNSRYSNRAVGSGADRLVDRIRNITRH